MALAQDRWVKNLRCRSQQVEWLAMAWATNGRRFFVVASFFKDGQKKMRNKVKLFFLRADLKIRGQK